ncbi:hypothetical protein [Sulfitobacter sp.]|uniref:hypothetical protein n=1 Tax=Sulfitobacter sp. TaxID=1903071 RepID=UPI003F6CCFE3
MIPKDDIEAFAPDLEAADRIVERTKRGVPPGREMMADEVLPFIRAYVLMRDLAANSAAFMAELHARELDGMGVGADTTER